MLVATDKEKERQQGGRGERAGDHRAGGARRRFADRHRAGRRNAVACSTSSTSQQRPRAGESDDAVRASTCRRARSAPRVMQGSSPLATSAAAHRHGRRTVSAGRHDRAGRHADLPVTSGTVEFSRRFPRRSKSLVIVKKVRRHEARVAADSSASRTRRRRDAGDRRRRRCAGGRAAVTLTLTGLPHHSTGAAARRAVARPGRRSLGAWAATRPVTDRARASERKRLIARREKLFQDLVRLEHDHRRGQIDAARFAARREELMAALEHVYGALDSDDTSPEPADRAGRRRA